MANEILVWEGDRAGRYRLVLFFPVGWRSPATVGSPPQSVAPTPAPRDERGALSGWAVAANARDAQIVAGLDAGTLLYREVAMRKAPGLSAVQLLAEVQRVYAEQQADVQAWYDRTFQHVDTWLNAS